MLRSLIFYDTSRLARGILCDEKNSSTLCIIRLNIKVPIKICHILVSIETRDLFLSIKSTTLC